MEREINNKTIVVTGGADGIGYQIVKHFLAARVKQAVVVDINEEAGNKAVNLLNGEFGEKKAVFIKCDVTKDADKSTKIYRDYNVEILVNSAGIVVETDPKKCIDINLTATVQWSLKFLEYRKDKQGNGGTIINIASIFGYRITDFCPVYHSTKYGVVGFSRSLGHEKNYKRSGVRVIAICPGFTMTSLMKIFEDHNVRAEIKELGEAHVWQPAEKVGEETVKIFENVDSGTVWEIEGGVVREISL